MPDGSLPVHKPTSATQPSVIPLAEPWLGGEAPQVVAAQIQSGFVGPGKRTAEFAGWLRHFSGARQVVLTTSGTIALSVAAVALELKPGDEILVPAYGVISTINAFASIGLRPRLVDIDRRSGCMSAERLEAAIGPATRAVCFVNFSGNTGPMLLDVLDVCSRRGIPVIEDAACALGQRYNGKVAGTFGTVGTYSFSVPKVLTTGQGGAVLFGDDRRAALASAYIDHGDLEWRQTNLNRAVGTNLRFNDVLAALGLAQVWSLEERLARKRRAYAILREELGPFLWGVQSSEAPLHNIVFSQQADMLVQSLRTSAIQAVRQYRTISEHPAYRELAVEEYPNADWWNRSAVYLPFGLAMSEEDSLRIGRAVRDAGVMLELPA
jgi:perosamine synthetase